MYWKCEHFSMIQTTWTKMMNRWSLWKTDFLTRLGHQNSLWLLLRYLHFSYFTFKMESKQSVRYCYKTVCSIRSWTATHCLLLWLHTIIALDDSQPTCQPDFGGIFSESGGTVRQVYTVSLQCTHTARLWKLYDL